MNLDEGKMMGMSYQDFLQEKTITHKPSGFNVELSDLNDNLFDWQKVIVLWALSKGKAAIFADCGLGKTIMQLEWANQVYQHTGQDVFILAPLAVSKQTVREGSKFGISVNLCKDQNDWKPGINITNYEKMGKFDLSIPGGIVADECFSPDTPIDVFNIDKVLESKYIKNIKKGDIIFNVSGEDYVHSVCKRPIDRAVQVNIGGQRITCSENHPFFTLHGWKCAQYLQPDDNVMATETAVQLVRDNISTKICSAKNAKILRTVLLGEMENEYTGTLRKSSYCGGKEEKGKSDFKMVEGREPWCDKTTGKSDEFKSNSKIYKKDDSHQDNKRDIKAMERKKGRQRTSFSNPATDNDRCIGVRLVTRISNFFREKKERISFLLQGGFGKSCSENSNRNRWPWTRKQETENNRRKEKQDVEFIRVESVEILEQGHPTLEKYRDESGIVYFYDIEATKHPSFSVCGLIVHKSGILKSYSGKTRNIIIESFINTPYKLACTATPSPNDFMELGNHSEFLNVKSRNEMLATYFIHDSGDTSKWRLKGHVKDNIFWQWMCSWSLMVTKPSDIGFNSDGFVLPPLNICEHFVKSKPNEGELFVTEAADLMDRRKARKESIVERILMSKKIIESSSKKPWLCWCNLNAESDKLKKTISQSTEVRGSNKDDYKEQTLVDFADGNIPCMISKPSICGHGMNLQCCSNMVFVGLSDSYESMYQAIRRCWRFGQNNPVDVHIVLSEKEGSVLRNIKNKEKKHQNMIANMVKNMSDITKNELNVRRPSINILHNPVKRTGKNWTLYHRDCIDVARKIESDSIDYTIFSPPFASLYTYSDSICDMGNSNSDDAFMLHFQFLIKEMYRITNPGRLVSIHCMDLPAMKERDGYIGLKDFSGELIRNMQKEGFVYHSRVMIWKDPLIEVTRTKSRGLLHKQIMKDSSKCRQGLPDYILTFVKPGENAEMISHPDGFTQFIGNNEPIQDGIEYSHHVWRKYASPVWMDINQSNTLNKKLAREKNDEKHICPLQLDVIARCIDLWSNPGDLVADWFTGIGSTGYQALKMDRCFVGAELKKSYFDIAVGNLKGISNGDQPSLF